MINNLVKNKKMTKFIFLLSVFFMITMSASLMLAYKASDKAFYSNDRTPLLIDGAIFWGSFILAYVLFIIVSKVRRKDLGKAEKKLPGMLVFFSNPIAKISDCVMILSVIALTV